jgi:hypothetical protein
MASPSGPLKTTRRQPFSRASRASVSWGGVRYSMPALSSLATSPSKSSDSKQFQIGDSEARAGFVFVVMFAAKVRFVELNRPIDIGDIQCNMINALKHANSLIFSTPIASIGRA